MKYVVCHLLGCPLCIREICSVGLSFCEQISLFVYLSYTEHMFDVNKKIPEAVLFMVQLIWYGKCPSV